ncbi:MAG: hypothetical protein EBY41_02600 [Proteobacteria bacterium]|nr:hypothetical protein [Pseudomonadota bacterium]
MLKKDQASRTHYFQHSLLDEKKLDRQTSDGGRVYVTEEGNAYPSVTTVLSELNKASIIEWRSRVGEEAANKITARAVRRGTKVHGILEDFVSNKDNYLEGHMPSNIEMFKVIEPFLTENVEEIYGIEIKLYSDTLRAAGTADLYCKYRGLPTILDFKTSRKEKREDWILNYKLQCSTYAMMVEEIYGLIVPQYCILIGNDEGTVQEFIGDTYDYRDQVIKIFEDYHT